MRKIVVFFLWMPLTLGTIVTFLYITTKINAPSKAAANQRAITYASSVLGAYQNAIIAGDARPAIISRFLTRYNCPLKPVEHYAQAFVEAADANNLDFRLLPAISMQESNCCRKLPADSNNCWGYGIYGDQVIRFTSIEAGMKIVARTLAKNYSDKGLLEPIEIMQKYTPGSEGNWALGVTRFMEEMR